MTEDPTLAQYSAKRLDALELELFRKAVGDVGMQIPMAGQATTQTVPVPYNAALVEEIAPKYGVDPALVHAVIHAESRGNAGAISPKGALGLMQLMPDTAREFQVSNPFDAGQNITGGVRKLAGLTQRYHGNVPLMLAAYNAGEGAVERYGGIPPYPETQGYVQQVMAQYRGQQGVPPPAGAPGGSLSIPQGMASRTPSGPMPPGADQQPLRAAERAQPLTPQPVVPTTFQPTIQRVPPELAQASQELAARQPADVQMSQHATPEELAALSQELGQGAEAVRNAVPMRPEVSFERSGAGILSGAAGAVQGMALSPLAFGITRENTPAGRGLRKLAQPLATIQQAMAIKDPTVIDQAFSALGSQLGYLTATIGLATALEALIGPIALTGLTMTAINAVTESAGEASETYENLRGLVGDDEAQSRASSVFLKNVALIGATDAAGQFSTVLKPILRGVLGAGMEGFLPAIERGVSAGLEGLQEGVQYSIQNKEMWVPADSPNAGHLAQYGWKRDGNRMVLPWSGVDAATATIIGTVLGGVGSAVTEGMRNPGMQEGFSRLERLLSPEQLALIRESLSNEAGAIRFGPEPTGPEAPDSPLPENFFDRIQVYDQLMMKLQGGQSIAEVAQSLPETIDAPVRREIVTTIADMLKNVSTSFSTAMGNERGALGRVPENTAVREGYGTEEPGAPKVVYHGTPSIAAGESPDPGQAQETQFGTKGAWFAEDPQVAGGSGASVEDLGYATPRGPASMDTDRIEEQIRQTENDLNLVRDYSLDHATLDREASRYVDDMSDSGQERLGEIDRRRRRLDQLLRDFGSPTNAQTRLQATLARYNADLEAAGQDYTDIPQVHPVFLDIQRPFDMTKPLTEEDMTALERVINEKRYPQEALPIESQQQADELQQDLDAALRGGKRGRAVFDAIAEQLGGPEPARQLLETAGFDGIFHHSVEDGRVWVAFQPEQIIPAFSLMDALRNQRGAVGREIVPPVQPPSPALPEAPPVSPAGQVLQQSAARMAQPSAQQTLPLDETVITARMAELQQFARDYEALSIAQRRGVRPHEQAQREGAQLAQEQGGLDIRQLIPPGTAMTDTEVAALAQQVGAQRNRAAAAAQAVVDTIAQRFEELQALRASTREETRAANPEASSGQRAAMSRQALTPEMAAFTLSEEQGRAVANMVAEIYTLGRYGLLPSEGVAAESGRTLSTYNDPVSGVQNMLAGVREAIDSMRTLPTNEIEAAMIMGKAFASLPTVQAQVAHAKKLVEASRLQVLGKIFWELAYFDFLSGGATFAANMSSNTGMALFNIPLRLETAVVSGIRRAITGANTGVRFGEAWQLLHGYTVALTQGMFEVGKHIAAQDLTREQIGTALENQQLPDLLGIPADDPWRVFFASLQLGRTTDQESKIPIERGLTAQNLGANPASNIGFAADLLGEFIRSSGDALHAADQFSRSILEHGELYAQAIRKASESGLQGQAFWDYYNKVIQERPKDVVAAMKSYGIVNTFNAELGPAGQAISQAIAAIPGGRLVVPFYRVGTNMGKAGSEYIFGLNLASMGLHALFGKENALLQQWRSPGVERDTAIAKIALSAQMAAAVAVMVGAGFLTGYGPQDPTVRKNWMDMGNKPFSFQWRGSDGTLHTLDYTRWTEPFGLIMGTIATSAEIIGRLSTMAANTLAGAIVLAYSESMLSKTWFRGLFEVQQAISPRAMDQPENALSGIGRFFTSLLTGPFLPASSMLRSMRRSQDPLQREVMTLMDAYKNAIPGESETLPPDYDLLGHPRYYPPGIGPDMLSPIHWSATTQTPLMKEIDRLTQQFSMGISYPAKTWILGKAGTRVPLTPDEYARVQLLGTQVPFKELFAIGGRGAKDVEALKAQMARELSLPRTALHITPNSNAEDFLGALISAPAFRDLSDFSQLSILKKAFGTFRDIAKDLLVAELWNKYPSGHYPDGRKHIGAAQRDIAEADVKLFQRQTPQVPTPATAGAARGLSIGGNSP